MLIPPLISPGCCWLQNITNNRPCHHHIITTTHLWLSCMFSIAAAVVYGSSTTMALSMLTTTLQWLAAWCWHSPAFMAMKLVVSCGMSSPILCALTNIDTHLVNTGMMASNPQTCNVTTVCHPMPADVPHHNDKEGTHRPLLLPRQGTHYLTPHHGNKQGTVTMSQWWAGTLVHAPLLPCHDHPNFLAPALLTPQPVLPFPGKQLRTVTTFLYSELLRRLFYSSLQPDSLFLNNDSISFTHDSEPIAIDSLFMTYLLQSSVSLFPFWIILLMITQPYWSWHIMPDS